MREATHTTRCERAVRAVWEHARCAAGRAEGERPEDARIPGAERPALEAGPRGRPCPNASADAAKRAQSWCSHGVRRSVSYKVQVGELEIALHPYRVRDDFHVGSSLLDGPPVGVARTRVT